jgi:hypothetical protein
VSRLFSVDSGFKELPYLTRTLYSIIVTANTADEALLFAQRRYPEALSEGSEHRVVEVEHVWPDGEVAIVEKQHSKQLHG